MKRSVIPASSTIHTEWQTEIQNS